MTVNEVLAMLADFAESGSLMMREGEVRLSAYEAYVSFSLDAESLVYWRRIICGDYAEQVLRRFPDVVCFVIPELRECVGFNQKSPHHNEDVYNHSVSAVGHCKHNDFVLRMALLLHDCGKPRCFSVDENGIGHFYGHMHPSAEIAAQVCTRLGIGAEETASIVALVEGHELVHEPTRKSVRRRIRKLPDPENDVWRLIQLMECDRMAHAPGHTDLHRVQAFAEYATEIMFAE